MVRQPSIKDKFLKPAKAFQTAPVPMVKSPTSRCAIHLSQLCRGPRLVSLGVSPVLWVQVICTYRFPWDDLAPPAVLLIQSFLVALFNKIPRIWPSISYLCISTSASISYWTKTLWWKFGSHQPDSRRCPVQYTYPLWLGFLAMVIPVDSWKLLLYQISTWSKMLPSQSRNFFPNTALLLYVQPDPQCSYHHLPSVSPEDLFYFHFHEFLFWHSLLPIYSVWD